MNKFFDKIKRTGSLALTGALLASLCGCGTSGIPSSEGMRLVGSFNVEEEAQYSDESKTEEVLDTFASDDGLCVIGKYPSYYDVTLDYENGTSAEVGAAYAMTILKAVPDYEECFEPYLYENIRDLFSGREINYSALETRIMTLEASIPDKYREEIESFARTIAGDEEGYEENGKLSYIEAITMQMIPDALRPTACSALSIGGSRTASGERITMRNLEWNIGSSAQMTMLHCVTHMNRGDGSITSVAVLGLLDMITAINDDGVMIGILDVGTVNGMPFVYENKKCYTFEIRYALDHFDNARDAAEYLSEESGDFTWCNNLIVTDANDAFCCENATSEVQEAGRAVSVIRTPDSELMEGLEWDTPDTLCIVNSFATRGNQDGFTGIPSDITRFVKYNRWVREIGEFTVADMKGIMSREVVDQYEVVNVHNSGTVHTFIVDYATGNLHVAFTSGSCADDIPEYILVGNYK
ncbi:MAG: hypothetical protein K5871_11055 [Lachnospiraceae bacterium]|nr:hypothetical protein [Lachnospiraceae bacterium]